MSSNEFELHSLKKTLSEAGATWDADETGISTLTPAQRQRRLGFVPPPGKASLAQRVAMAKTASLQHAVKAVAPLPASIDWRSHGGNYVTPVKDQGDCKSCVAFGTLATMESATLIAQSAPGGAIDLSEAHLFFCYGGAEGRSCGNGWWVEAALGVVQSSGVVDDQAFRYTAQDQPCPGDLPGCQRHRITGWQALTSPAAIKQWLVERGPLVTCMTVYTDFFYYKGGVYRYHNGNEEGGHCICCIGYDDANGCWIAKNSWRDDWGEGGFFRIAYGDCGFEAEMWGIEGVA